MLGILQFLSHIKRANLFQQTLLPRPDVRYHFQSFGTTIISQSNRIRQKQLITQVTLFDK